MYTYVISKINIKKIEAYTKKKISPRSVLEKIIQIPPPLKIHHREIITGNSGIALTIDEPISIKFYYLEGPIDTILRTEMVIDFEKNPGFVVSSPRGVGILKRGNARKYVDNFIGPVVIKSLFGSSKYYTPFTHNDGYMDHSVWGEELRKIKVDISDVGTMILKGQELTKTLEKFGDFQNFIEKGNIDSFKVYSQSLNRVIEVLRGGIIKTSNKNIVDISDFIVDIYK